MCDQDRIQDRAMTHALILIDFICVHSMCREEQYVSNMPLPTTNGSDK